MMKNANTRVFDGRCKYMAPVFMQSFDAIIGYQNLAFIFQQPDVETAFKLIVLNN